MPHAVTPTIETLAASKRAFRVMWGLWALVMVVAAVVYAWKAADSRSAFVRWRHQVLDMQDGVNIWERYYFPNPPILPIMLFPLLVLPAVPGALAWYAIKAAMVTWVVVTLARMARGPHGPPLHSIGIALVLMLAGRPIMSDLQHGNINILILFLVVAALEFWRRGGDVGAGLTLALAIATKVTPALFVPYLLYKRAWKAAAWCGVGLVLYLLVVPSVVLGPEYNWRVLMTWRHNIISPFVEGEVIRSTQEVNQSMVGVITRLTTQSKELAPHSNGGTEHDLNLASWPPEQVAVGVKVLSIGLVLLLGFLCRTRALGRDDPRLLGEYALVVLTMLFVSERSWKHHFVTIVLPLMYLVYQLFMARLTRGQRVALAATLLVSAALMSSTSDGVGGLFADGVGHEYALFFGMFLWSALCLYIATAWRVRVLRCAPLETRAPAYVAAPGNPSRPHLHGPAARVSVAMPKGVD